jgi:copper homeostasis protein (lipoprotein)
MDHGGSPGGFEAVNARPRGSGLTAANGGTAGVDAAPRRRHDAPMPRLRLIFPLLLLLAACGPGADTAQAPAGGRPGDTEVAAAPAEESERVWAGLLPCRDCQGIDTRLVLRTSQGRRDYVLTETYLGGSGKTSFNREGTWTELRRSESGEAQVTYVLDPEQATQRYSLQPDGALELLDTDGKAPAQALAYRLQRL